VVRIPTAVLKFTLPDFDLTHMSFSFANLCASYVCCCDFCT